jgi:hypothetical protein
LENQSLHECQITSLTKGRLIMAQNIFTWHQLSFPSDCLRKETIPRVVTR